MGHGNKIYFVLIIYLIEYRKRINKNNSKKFKTNKTFVKDRYFRFQI